MVNFLFPTISWVPKYIAALLIDLNPKPFNRMCYRNNLQV